MSNSIRISELNDLSTLTSDDFFPVVDSGSLTTYRTTVQSINSWSLASGSVSSSLVTISASYARVSDTASYSISSSFLIYPNSSTASFSQKGLSSSYADNSVTASNLGGIGSSQEYTFQVLTKQVIGTDAGIHITSPKAALSWTYASNLKSVGDNTILFDSSNAPTGFSRIFHIEDVGTNRRLIFDLSPNYSTDYLGRNFGPDVNSISSNNRGFSFTFGDGTQYGTLLYIRENGRVYANKFEAEEFSSSLVDRSMVGFYGTASWSQNTTSASYASSGGESFTMPPGMIASFATRIVPSGWLNCSGSEVLITDYPLLATAIYVDYTTETGSLFGYKTNGSGTKTNAGLYFKLPDLRGTFVRGFSYGRTGSPEYDSNRIWAVTQSNALHDHVHSVWRWKSGIVSGGTPLGDYNGYDYSSGALNATASNETRPFNIPMMYCIKI